MPPEEVPVALKLRIPAAEAAEKVATATTNLARKRWLRRVSARSG
jgi:hypothetical protein